MKDVANNLIYFLGSDINRLTIICKDREIAFNPKNTLVVLFKEDSALSKGSKWGDNMNNNPLYRKTEALLYNYNKSKAQIKNIELEIENIKNEYEGVGAVSFEERVQSTNEFHSRVESEILEKENQINKLMKYKRQKEIEIAKIDNAIEALTDREKSIIKMRYFEKYNNRMIAAKLDLTEEWIAKIKKVAINQILDAIF